MNALLIVLAAWPFTSDVAPEQIVARAQGPRGEITVTAERLRRYAEAHPDRSPRALAEEIIEFELLAAEAAAQGVEGGAELRDAVHEALVRRYLATVFEDAWQVETVPEALARQAYQKNKSRFVYPETRRAIHVVLVGADGKPLAADSPAEAPAQALATRIAEALVAEPPADNAAFTVAAERFTVEAAAVGLLLKVEDLGRFAPKGRYVEDFTRQAFLITAADVVSAAFRTEFGWHVLQVREVIPARNDPYEAVADQIRARILPEVRGMKLRELTDQLADRYEALVNLVPLQQLEARRTGTEPPSK